MDVITAINKASSASRPMGRVRWIMRERIVPTDLAPVAVICLGCPTATPEPVTREKPRIIWTADAAGLG